MNIIEFNKYRPSIFKNGRYLKDDWISASQIGEIWNGARLDADAYLSVEDRYVRAIASVLDLAALAKLTVRGLEFWEPSTSEVLPRLPTVPAPREGSEVFAHEVGDLVRRFLREQAWAELVVDRVFLLHPSYDLRFVVATVAPRAEVDAVVRGEGLFAYEGDSNLPTLDSWRGGSGTSV